MLTVYDFLGLRSSQGAPTISLFTSLHYYPTIKCLFIITLAMILPISHYYYYELINIVEDPLRLN